MHGGAPFRVNKLKTIHDPDNVRDLTEAWRKVGESVALVPTMGNLHKGHMSLVNLVQEYAERVVVSVFVNPTQFGPGEDFAEYPRTLATDTRRLSRAGVDVLFAPEIDHMYPRGQDDATTVIVPGLSDELCGVARPGHFAGVTSIVARLFNLLQPNVAVFGQKDYQQLVIIRRMVSDLCMPIRIIAGQTYREDDGLALSSRNQYLSADERAIAPGLYRTIEDCRGRLTAGATDTAALEREGFKKLESLGFQPEYIAVRKAGDLSSPGPTDRNLVVLVAARLGTTRLIDNVLVERQV